MRDVGMQCRMQSWNAGIQGYGMGCEDVGYKDAGMQEWDAGMRDAEIQGCGMQGWDAGCNDAGGGGMQDAGMRDGMRDAGMRDTGCRDVGREYMGILHSITIPLLPAQPRDAKSFTTAPLGSWGGGTG